MSPRSEPLVCVVDDAQWLDRASAQALAFVARRLLAESVAMVIAVRELRPERELVGLPELLVEGLSDGDARVLLDSVIHGPLDEAFETGSSPRHAGTRWRCWSCRGG